MARVLGITTEQIGAQTVKDRVRIVAKYAFGDEYWPALERLITNESGWNPYAMNKSSGACGLFQALPCSKVITQAGSLDNVEGQAEWGIQYIKGRYGDPNRALEFWLSQSPHWY